ncbi:PorP/SprF family type IX secretion system membrane protein [Aquimarina sp. 2201CG14-23]|uniref:PorP/SprF family type IX secretion system membrane protein n=1 Tax=Aquimarina mycalae TaxID=3040073 RepID=UPI002477D6DA|nr:type IX secretion system membrane protein PorP/SprF [Aquimarina sp. 2201CG14-23]MDH7445343.1 type IX secretion system membrane protein PorP/SprF [Aquimarina sp. 2201CG14-23]
MNLKKYYLLVAVLISQFVFSQEGIPVYADYLSDNLYLVHPAMAGASNANKIRLTARKQWFDVDNAPSTQSANINFRTGDKVGLGGIIYRDENGRFTQTGVYATFAYHLLFSRDRTDLNMLSFGMSGAFIQSNVDVRDLFDPADPDPAIEFNQVQKDAYFNVDVGVSYHYLDWYAHITVKNLLPAARDAFDNTDDFATIRDSNNQRRYIFSLGYVFGLGNGPWSLEPSLLYQATDQTQESSIDANMKVYRRFGELATLWGGLSYRRSFDGAEFSQTGVEIESQKLQYITPFLGINYKNWMVGYTYSYQSNSVVLSNGGFHQLTLGYDFGKRKERWNCNCPAVNN